MEFTVADRESKTWLKIKARCEQQLALLRKQNDGKMSENDRNFLIGRIYELNTLLNIDKPSVVIPE